MSDTPFPQGLMLSDDLIFISKVAGAAQSLGLSVQSARSADALVALAERQAPGGVLLDLNHPELDLPELLSRLRVACPVMPLVVGYGSHVEAATLHAARLAGCDRVLPRSRFVEELPRSLRGWLRGEGAGE